MHGKLLDDRERRPSHATAPVETSAVDCLEQVGQGKDNDDRKAGFLNTVWFKAGALLALFIAAFCAVAGTANIWFTSEDYSYVHHPHRYRISDLGQEGRLGDVSIRDWPVLPVLVGCVILSLYGILVPAEHLAPADSHSAHPVYLVLFQQGSVSSCFFGFLIFMVPIPAFWKELWVSISRYPPRRGRSAF
jgi:hypothetical protein